MSDVADLARQVARAGVRLEVTPEGHLRIDAPAGALGQADLDELRKGKDEVVALVKVAGEKRRLALERLEKLGNCVKRSFVRPIIDARGEAARQCLLDVLCYVYDTVEQIHSELDPLIDQAPDYVLVLAERWRVEWGVRIEQLQQKEAS